jgi:hypothetical protein
MKTKKFQLVKMLSFLTFLLATSAAFGFYDPAVQRWVNRDPLNDLGFELLSSRKQFDFRIKEQSITLLREFIRNANIPEYIRHEIQRTHMNSGFAIDPNTENLYKFAFNTPIGLVDPIGLSCRYECFRFMTLIPWYFCVLQDDGCDGACPSSLIINPGGGFHIAIPFTTPCPGCIPHGTMPPTT